MSRSTKYPMWTLTGKIDKDFAHKQVRKHVNSVLQTMDYNDPPIIDIEADTRSLGIEEYGTKFGYDFMGSLGEDERVEFEEDQKKCMRK